MLARPCSILKRYIKYSWDPQQNGAPALQGHPAVMPSVQKSWSGNNCLQMQEKLRGILECVHTDSCKTEKVTQRNPKWQVFQLCLLTLGCRQRTQDRLTLLLSPFYFCGEKPQGCLLFPKPLCCPQKSNSLPSVQHTNERDIGVYFRAIQAWLLPALLKLFSIYAY